jgi:hypothetical protein
LVSDLLAHAAGTHPAVQLLVLLRLRHLRRVPAGVSNNPARRRSRSGDAPGIRQTPLSRGRSAHRGT